MSALIVLLGILYLSFGFHFAMQHRLCALVGGLVPLLLVALALLPVPLHLPTALVFIVSPFAVPFALIASASAHYPPPWIVIVLCTAFCSVFNAGYYTLVAGVVAWVRRRLSTRSSVA